MSVSVAGAAGAPLALKEHGLTDGSLKIILQLFHARNVGSEHQILNVDMQRQPIRRQYPETGTEIHREVLIPGEIDAAYAANHVERAGHGEIATDKDLARQQVVAQRQVVVREAPLSIGKQLDIAQCLETGVSGLGATVDRLGEKILADVIVKAQPGDRLSAEVLDRDL